MKESKVPPRILFVDLSDEDLEEGEPINAFLEHPGQGPLHFLANLTRYVPLDLLTEQRERLLAEAKEDAEACAVSFDWISTATDLAEIQEYARNCAELIRTGDFTARPQSEAPAAEGG